ncbi:MAG: hypothetical protein WCT05_14555 [Lentisphaeria bacterium]
MMKSDSLTKQDIFFAFSHVVRQIFMHRSGIYKRLFYNNIQKITDWITMRQCVANASVEFEPGNHTQYQAGNYTWLLGERMLRPKTAATAADHR